MQIRVFFQNKEHFVRTLEILLSLHLRYFRYLMNNRKELHNFCLQFSLVATKLGIFGHNNHRKVHETEGDFLKTNVAVQAADEWESWTNIETTTTNPSEHSMHSSYQDFHQGALLSPQQSPSRTRVLHRALFMLREQKNAHDQVFKRVLLSVCVCVFIFLRCLD